MWPWRQKGAGGDDTAAGAASGAVAAGQGPVVRGEWRALPPIRPAVQAHPLINPVQRFSGSLASWSNPSFLAPLGHQVSSAEPAGVIADLATPVRAERPAVELPVVSRTVARPAQEFRPSAGLSFTTAAPEAAPTPAEEPPPVDDEVPEPPMPTIAAPEPQPPAPEPVVTRRATELELPPAPPRRLGLGAPLDQPGSTPAIQPSIQRSALSSISRAADSPESPEEAASSEAPALVEQSSDVDPPITVARTAAGEAPPTAPLVGDSTVPRSITAPDPTTPEPVPTLEPAESPLPQPEPLNAATPASPAPEQISVVMRQTESAPAAEPRTSVPLLGSAPAPSTVLRQPEPLAPQQSAPPPPAASSSPREPITIARHAETSAPARNPSLPNPTPQAATPTNAGTPGSPAPTTVGSTPRPGFPTVPEMPAETHAAPPALETTAPLLGNTAPPATSPLPEPIVAARQAESSGAQADPPAPETIAPLLTSPSRPAHDPIAVARQTESTPPAIAPPLATPAPPARTPGEPLTISRRTESATTAPPPRSATPLPSATSAEPAGAQAAQPAPETTAPLLGDAILPPERPLPEPITQPERTEPRLPPSEITAPLVGGTAPPDLPVPAPITVSRHAESPTAHSATATRQPSRLDAQATPTANPPAAPLTVTRPSTAVDTVPPSSIAPLLGSALPPAIQRSTEPEPPPSAVTPALVTSRSNGSPAPAPARLEPAAQPSVATPVVVSRQVAAPEPVTVTRTVETTVQRVEEAPPSTTTASTPPAVVQAEKEPDQIAQELFVPLLRRIKAELQLDRERRGALTDLWH